MRSIIPLTKHKHNLGAVATLLAAAIEILGAAQLLVPGVHKAREKRVRLGCGRAAFIDPGVGCSSRSLRCAPTRVEPYTEQPGSLVVH
jgi:hypothetical protein